MGFPYRVYGAWGVAGLGIHGLDSVVFGRGKFTQFETARRGPLTILTIVKELI